MYCAFCPHQCGALRDDTHGEGRCRMPALPRVARAALHHGEEPCISGENGSGTIFFSGCPLSCRFCQNRTISHEDFGKTIDAAHLEAILRRLVKNGAHNLNFVNPTHYAHVLAEVLSAYRPPVPVVYNTSGYERVETLKRLEGLVDIYLPDYKYADDALALTLSRAPHYRETALAAIAEMQRQTGALTLKNGLAVKGTLIRHLVLPGHTQNSIAALTDIRDTFGSDAFVSLLFQYTPIGNHLPKELTRTLTLRECEKVFTALCDLGLTNGFVQDPQSSGTDYIPAFDLTGI